MIKEEFIFAQRKRRKSRGSNVKGALKQNCLFGWQLASTLPCLGLPGAWVAANKKEEQRGHCAQLWRGGEGGEGATVTRLLPSSRPRASRYLFHASARSEVQPLYARVGDVVVSTSNERHAGTGDGQTASEKAADTGWQTLKSRDISRHGGVAKTLVWGLQKRT